jgi:tripartite-type tricarboxylate transporter receptor subunit TctC
VIPDASPRGAGRARRCGAAFAQDYPHRPITLICRGPRAARPTRTCASSPSSRPKHLGQPIIVENKPGAGGMLGPGAMAQQRRARRLHALAAHMNAFRQPHMQKVDWDPLKDFTYIIGVSGYTFGLVVKTDSPFKTFGDLIAYAKANPGKLSYSSTGTGTSPHLLWRRSPRRPACRCCTCRTRATPTRPRR